jgi:putative transposase
VDKNGANFAGLENINMSPILTDLISFIEICPVNYLNNIVEQDHRFIKKIKRPVGMQCILFSADGDYHWP